MDCMTIQVELKMHRPTQNTNIQWRKFRWLNKVMPKSERLLTFPPFRAHASALISRSFSTAELSKSSIAGVVGKG